MSQLKDSKGVVRKTAPGPKGLPVVGNLPQRRRAPIGFFMDAVREHGDVVKFQFGPRVVHLVRHPNHIKYVLQDNNRNYGRQTRGHEMMRSTLGQGLVTSDGEFWKRQRRIAQPAFHRQRVASFADAIVKATEAMLVRWQQHAGTGRAIDIAAEMMKVTLQIVGETLLSTDVSQDADQLGEAFTIAMHHITDRMTNIFALPDSFPTRENRKFHQAVRTLDRVVFGMIAERRAGQMDRGDLLSMLMMAKDEETGESMTDQQLRDETMTMFIAGHETTSNALAWTWYLLSKSPGVARQIRAELAEVLAGRAPAFSDLPKLKFTTLVIKESMRLYPPAWLFARSSIEEDEIGGYYIPAGSIVALSPYVTHRDPAFWPNPEGFDPERFAGEQVAQLPRFAYFPFGGGPHQCIGNEFAMMEAQLIIATLMQRYRLDLTPGSNIEPEPLITIRPRNGLMMMIEPV